MKPFTKQIESGTTESFFYGLEESETSTIHIMRHQGTLDSFPTNLEYKCQLSDGIPLFKEKSNETRT